ncbi:MAG: hypothetical protein L0H96_11065 [Humibacillus sp.]|nr:hypothetical protein [Humibacillus sp.]
MVNHSIIRITGLVSALFVGLVMSAGSALAVRPRDPSVGGEPAPTPVPAPAFEVFGQTWQLALAIVVAGIAVVALMVSPTRRRPLPPG